MSHAEIVSQNVREDRTWYINADIREGSVPDMNVRTRTTIRPNRIHVTLLSKGLHPRHVERVAVTGLRVLASGKLSTYETRQDYNEWTWNDPGNAPEWVRDYVNGLLP